VGTLLSGGLQPSSRQDGIAASSEAVLPNSRRERCNRKLTGRLGGSLPSHAGTLPVALPPQPVKAITASSATIAGTKQVHDRGAVVFDLRDGVLGTPGPQWGRTAFGAFEAEVSLEVPGSG